MTRNQSTIMRSIPNNKQDSDPMTLHHEINPLASDTARPDQRPAGSHAYIFEHLPGSLTPLIGRAHELQMAQRRLLRPEVRLLTLTGPPGVGKTRLARALWAELLEEFTDGVRFVALASLSEPELVVPTIAHALGLLEDEAGPTLEHVKTFLREKQLLLVLDNLEQLLPIAPLLVEVLAACPQLKLLVTSRVALHLPGEYEFAVPLLAVPDPQALPALDLLAHIASVELFVQRVEAIKPGFALTEANAADIAQICARLEGLPLALELAAARCKLLSLQALLVRLQEQGLEVLSGSGQHVPTRQQTLRRTIAWSYDLLPTEAQALLRRLCVFVGDFSLEAAETVVSALGGLTSSVLDGIALLLDSSLLHARLEEGHKPGLHLLKMIREYGWEQLKAQGERERCRDAHAAYYLAFAEQAEPALESAGQGAWLERLEQEYDNIRTALQWLLARREPETALRIASALRQYWFLRGHLSEGRRFLEQALAASEEGTREQASPLRAKALNAAGYLADTQHDSKRAAVYYEASLDLFQRLQDQPGIAASLGNLGIVRYVLGELEQGISQMEESLRLYREMGDARNSARFLTLLGIAALFRGEYGQARERFEESLELLTAANDTWRKAVALHYLGAISYAQGHTASARRLSEESLALFRALGLPFYASEVMTLLAYELTALGDTTAARALLEEALAIAQTRENPEDLARVLCGLGHLALRQGNLAEGQDWFGQGVTKMQGRWLVPRIKWVLASCLEGLAEIALTQDLAAHAVQLFAAAQTVRAAHGYYSPFGLEQPFYDRTLAAARNQLGEHAFAPAWDAGLLMTPEQALRADAPPPPLEEVPALLPVMPQPGPKPLFPNGLTAREVEVLRLLVQGLSNSQIAEQLVLSPNTVHVHIQTIYRKLDVTSRSSATRFALERHLI